MAKEETKKTVKKPVSKAAAPARIATQSVAGGKPVVKKEATKSAIGGSVSSLKVPKPAVKKQEAGSKKQGKETKVVSEKVKSEVAVSKPTKASAKTYASVTIDVVGLDGKAKGKVSLPGEMFGSEINKALLAQAVRIYLANQRQGNASTKTRGEVDGSTAKIYRQKGTGRARHGSKRAPIFVKGGIVFGPKPRDFSLAFPQKMKRKALFSALSAKVNDKTVTVIDGLLEIKPKTKVFTQMLKSLGVVDKKPNVLFVTAGKAESVLRAGRNVQGVSFIPSKQVNTYAVLAARRVIVMKDAIDEMKEHFLKK